MNEEEEKIHSRQGSFNNCDNTQQRRRSSRELYIPHCDCDRMGINNTCGGRSAYIVVVVVAVSAAADAFICCEHHTIIHYFVTFTFICVLYEIRKHCANDVRLGSNVRCVCTCRWQNETEAALQNYNIIIEGNREDHGTCRRLFVQCTRQTKLSKKELNENDTKRNAQTIESCGRCT